MLKPPGEYRPLLVRYLHWAFPRLWARNWLPPPDLQPETLLMQARTRARLEDFGGEDFRPAMDTFLASARAEARLTALGATMTHGSALNALVARLRAQQLLGARPDWAARRLAPPVVIAGPMRSGTTLLQRLMALHPGLLHLKLFEALLPAPPPPGHTDTRPQRAAAMLGMMRWWSPEAFAIHPMRARWADEELALFELSFWGAYLEAQRPVPSFARWCEAADARPAYRHLATMLRLIGGRRGAPEDRPWLLKTPQHMANLDTLAETFPGARIIITHRDPAAVVGSAASLAWHSMVLQTDDLEPHWVGREWLYKTRDRMAKAAAYRARPDAAPILDIDYEETTRDPIGVLKRALDFAGLDLPASVKAAADAWLAAEAQRPRAAHRYRLEDFGLSAEEVRAELAPFARR